MSESYKKWVTAVSPNWNSLSSQRSVIMRTRIPYIFLFRIFHALSICSGRKKKTKWRRRRRRRRRVSVRRQTDSNGKMNEIRCYLGWVLLPAVNRLHVHWIRNMTPTLASNLYDNLVQKMTAWFVPFPSSYKGRSKIDILWFSCWCGKHNKWRERQAICKQGEALFGIECNRCALLGPVCHCSSYMRTQDTLSCLK